MNITYRRAITENELRQILSLQKNNIAASLTKEDKETEGYVTVEHTYDLLKRMNNSCAHIIAKHADIVVGYALVMLPSFRNEIPLLKLMFENADRLEPDSKYLTMGQICIAKEYRKKGIFKGLYSFYKKQLQHEYDGLFTEVASNNVRSMQAHIKVGFKVRQTRINEGVSWKLIYWDWKKNKEL